MSQTVTESAILSSCLKWLWLQGCFVWRNNSGAANHTYERKDGSIGKSYIRYGYPGSADIIGLNKHGRFLAIETKKPGRKLDPKQQEFKQHVEAHGGVFVMATGVDDLEANKALLLASKCPTMHVHDTHQYTVLPKGKKGVGE